MLNTIFLIWGLIPAAIGLGFLFRPRKMVRAQATFRKRLERLEKRLYKAHRATGLAFLLLALVFLLSYFNPTWIYNMFLATRLVMGVLFPELFEPASAIEGSATVPLVCI